MSAQHLRQSVRRLGLSGVQSSSATAEPLDRTELPRNPCFTLPIAVWIKAPASMKQHQRPLVRRSGRLRKPLFRGKHRASGDCPNRPATSFAYDVFPPRGTTPPAPSHHALASNGTQCKRQKRSPALPRLNKNERPHPKRRQDQARKPSTAPYIDPQRSPKAARPYEALRSIQAVQDVPKQLSRVTRASEIHGPTVPLP